MKVVDAVWEKRNLGVSSFEMEVEVKDTIEEVRQVLNETKAQYLVLKVPADRTDVTWLVKEYGYTYVEDMIFLEHDLKPVVRTPLQQRFYDAIRVEPMVEEDYAVVLDEINHGAFSFDRISNDPHFGQEPANRRFCNWLNDERERGAEFLKVIKVNSDEMIGFFTIRDTGNGVYTSALGGTFMKWRRGGLGTTLQASEEVRKRGGKKLTLGVSTNNMTQLRALIQNGCFPVRTNHVFVKHCDFDIPE